MALTATEILNAQDAQVIPLDVPEWKGSVFIRTVNGEERDRMETIFVALSGSLDNGHEMKPWKSEVASLMISDEAGNRIFTDADIEKIGKKNWKAIDRIVDAGMDHNGLTEAALEEAEKNSESDQSDDSGSS